MTGLGSKRFQQFQTLIRSDVTLVPWPNSYQLNPISYNALLVKGDYLHDYFICDVVKRDQGGIIFVFDLILKEANMDPVYLVIPEMLKS